MRFKNQSVNTRSLPELDNNEVILLFKSTSVKAFMFYFYFRSQFVLFCYIFQTKCNFFSNVVIAQLYSNAFANFFKNGQIHVKKLATSNSNVAICLACCSNNLLHHVVCKLTLLFIVVYLLLLLK